MINAQPEVATKTCSNCGHSFPCTADYFQRDATHPDGLRSRCKDCTNRAKTLAKLQKIRVVNPTYLAVASFHGLPRRRKAMMKCACGRGIYNVPGYLLDAAQWTCQKCAEGAVR